MCNTIATRMHEINDSAMNAKQWPGNETTVSLYKCITVLVSRVYLKVIFIFTLIGGEPGSIAVYIRLPTRNYSIVVVYTPPGLKKRQKEA